MKFIWRMVRLFFQIVVFFTLFAFALNNQQDTIVHFLFGYQWRAPQVLIVLAAFSAGVAVGVLGMMPWWWRRRRPEVSSVMPSLQDAPSSAELPRYTDGI
jgi:lipopolysaccharide assembly protein A